MDMQSPAEDTMCMVVLIERWGNPMHTWREIAFYCHGATMASDDNSVAIEYGFLNSIAWTRSNMELEEKPNAT